MVHDIREQLAKLSQQAQLLPRRARYKAPMSDERAGDVVRDLVAIVQAMAIDLYPAQLPPTEAGAKNLGAQREAYREDRRHRTVLFDGWDWSARDRAVEAFNHWRDKVGELTADGRGYDVAMHKLDVLAPIVDEVA